MTSSSSWRARYRWLHYGWRSPKTPSGPHESPRSRPDQFLSWVLPHPQETIWNYTCTWSFTRSVNDVPDCHIKKLRAIFNSTLRFKVWKVRGEGKKILQSYWQHPHHVIPDHATIIFFPSVLRSFLRDQDWRSNKSFNNGPHYSERSRLGDRNDDIFRWPRADLRPGRTGLNVAQSLADNDGSVRRRILSTRQALRPTWSCSCHQLIRAGQVQLPSPTKEHGAINSDVCVA